MMIRLIQLNSIIESDELEKILNEKEIALIYYSKKLTLEAYNLIEQDIKTLKNLGL